jgi:serine/threonine protein kinase
MSQQPTVGGHFQVVSRLSSGGFGETFLAEDRRFPERPKCVVKQLRPQTDDPEVRQLSKRLFEQEVNVLYQLGEHPQIPSIITHFEDAGEFYFVQEYIAGNTFAGELAGGRIFSQRQVVEIVTDLLEVLAFVHRRGVIHRDVKPSNLICRASDGKTVLIDFGAVKQVRSHNQNQSGHTTGHTVAIGSEGYMPMEQLGGHPRFSSDVYAAGMFAIELLTQTHPTKLRQNPRTGEWIWQDKVSVNPQFADFLNKMVRFDFRQRFTDATEALTNLQRLQLNFAKIEQNQEYFNNFGPRSEGGLTKATFFSPAFAPEGFSAPPPPDRFPPQFAENQPPYFSPPLPYHQPPPNHFGNQPYQNAPLPNLAAPVQNIPKKPTITENVTMGGLGFSFEDIKESPAYRTLVWVGLVAITGCLAFFGIYSGKRPSASQPSVQYGEVPGQPAFIKTKPKRTDSPYMTSAREKERTALTVEDWEDVAHEWELAENHFSRLESDSTDPAEKERARNDRIYCFTRKRTAINRSQIPNRKRN